MRVKELIELLLECDAEMDVVTEDYNDIVSVKQEKVFNFRNEVKSSTQHIILGSESNI